MTNKETNNLNEVTVGGISRRLFLTKGIAAAGSIFVALQTGNLHALASSSKKIKLDAALLKTKYGFKGKIFTAKDANFDTAVVGGLWNRLRPSNRRPQMVTQVIDEDDVVAVVKYAKANKVKVAIRGGGHNWCAPSVRNSGIMLDLTNMNQVISIDADKKRAVLQPVISNRQAQEELNKVGLSFPTGHCPQVKLSGYFLSGGMSWNQGTWGHGYEGLEAIEMVTAEGKKITASATENQDYFWAARGCGPGFFAVCTRYHLKCFPLPKAITASVYYYPYNEIEKIAEWLGPLASQLPSSIELSLFAVHAPDDIADQCKDSNGKVALVTATMFADNEDNAKYELQVLDNCPELGKAIKKSIAEPTTFPQLFDASGAIWSDGLRAKVDACFFDAPLTEVFKVNKEHFLKAHPKTVYMFAIFTGANPEPPKDACFTMHAKLYGGPWTMWEKADEDQKEIEWHNTCMKNMEPLIKGHYISESDTVSHPEYLEKAISKTNMEKIQAMRAKYDPDGVFFNFSDGLS
ncbi:FAD-binding oxidoreductase [bacterium]|nr:FAD-binding oxidoreductase [bacterium]